MADDISDFVYKVVKKLSYTKGYRGTVTEVGDGYAKVKIKSDIHTVKTDYPLVVGEAVVVLSLQNQFFKHMPVILLMLNTGWRVGELLALEWNDNY